MTAYLKVGLLLFIFLISCGSPEKKAPHGVLTDGQYDVVFAEDFADSFENFTLKITGNSYEKKFSSGAIVKGELERQSRTSYIFYDERPARDSTEMEKLLSGLGKQVLELTNIKDDTLEFRTTHEANLIITVNMGVIIRKKDE